MELGTASVRPLTLLRVVVADNGISVNDSLTALLSEFDGVSVLGCVQAPAKLFALVQMAQPDVVILDLQTEGGAALKTLKQIKRPRTPVVIVLSNYDLPRLRQAALDAGADHFLIKATETGRLQKLLQTLVRKSQGKRTT